MLGEATKAIVIVDNRGGAGGTIGADAVAKSAADGQTLLMATVGTHAINPTLYKKLPYNAVKDFTPIGLIAVAPVAVIVNPSLSARNLAELVALAKQKPGKLNYGSAGVGTPGHLTGKMFKAAAGINIQHVPYKGSAPAVTDLIAGQTDHVRSAAIGIVQLASGQAPSACLEQQGSFGCSAECADDCRVRIQRF
jgi:tripartite-type tricarboxylate transporter receptor subunit TctC